MLVDGRQRDSSFQRKTGYVQQQDLHLATTTVREALKFSALLRQPPQYSRTEKLEYVEKVIDLLQMRDYADAVVGVPGEGLNVEQRKGLTIGVELAARPKLLLFLDEPTSGLDSQTSWSICNLMETLTSNGQAILCTIHQPSAMLFQRFDRLLLLAEGGKTVYFGEIGSGSRTLMDYFVRNGGTPCPKGANPAEHMLEVIGAAPGAHTDIDWPAVWRNSPEYQQVRRELSRLRQLVNQPSSVHSDDPSSYSEFAASFPAQLGQVGRRVFQQYWRTPSYIYSKAILTVGSVSTAWSFLGDFSLTVRNCSPCLLVYPSSKPTILPKDYRTRCLGSSSSSSSSSNSSFRLFHRLSHNGLYTSPASASPRPTPGKLSSSPILLWSSHGTR
jgi:ATP-binding cassette subfamily G (WHITE) protein 2 (PDR)